MKYKAGDIVRILSRKFYGHNLAIGSIASIFRADSNTDLQLIGKNHHNERVSQTLHPHDIELIKLNSIKLKPRRAETTVLAYRIGRGVTVDGANPVFKVGERVRIIDNSNNHGFAIGEEIWLEEIDDFRAIDERGMCWVVRGWHVRDIDLERVI